MTESSPTRAGRRSGESTARADILAAARELFASNGFKSTSLRAVAAEAGVDVALVSYYFGSKHGLFVEALEVPVDPAQQLTRAADGPRSELGTRIITEFTGAWEGETTGTALQGLLRSIVNDPGRSNAFGEFASHRMVPLLAEKAGVDMDTARVLISCMFGMAMVRYLIGVPTFAEMTRDEVIAMYGPRLQLIVDADGTRTP